MTRAISPYRLSSYSLAGRSSSLRSHPHLHPYPPAPPTSCPARHAPWPHSAPTPAAASHPALASSRGLCSTAVQACAALAGLGAGWRTGPLCSAQLGTARLCPASHKYILRQQSAGTHQKPTFRKIFNMRIGNPLKRSSSDIGCIHSSIKGIT